MSVQRAPKVVRAAVLVLSHLLESIGAAPESEATDRAVDILLEYLITLVPHAGCASCGLALVLLFYSRHGKVNFLKLPLDLLSCAFVSRSFAFVSLTVRMLTPYRSIIAEARDSTLSAIVKNITTPRLGRRFFEKKGELSCDLLLLVRVSQS